MARPMRRRYSAGYLESGLQMLLRLKASSLSLRWPSSKVAMPRPIHPAAELGLISTALLKVSLASSQDFLLRQVRASLRQMVYEMLAAGLWLRICRKTSQHQNMRSARKQISAFSIKKSMFLPFFSSKDQTISNAWSYLSSPISTKASMCCFLQPSANLERQDLASPQKLQSMKYCINNLRISWDSCTESWETYLPGFGTFGAGSMYGFLGGLILIEGLFLSWQYFSASAMCLSLAFSWPNRSQTRASNWWMMIFSSVECCSSFYSSESSLAASLSLPRWMRNKARISRCLNSLETVLILEQKAKAWSYLRCLRQNFAQFSREETDWLLINTRFRYFSSACSTRLIVSYSLASLVSLSSSASVMPLSACLRVERVYQWLSIRSSCRTAESLLRHSSNAFSSMSLKKTFNYERTFCSASRVTAAPCFSFLHLSMMMALTVFAILSRRRPYLPDATNSCKNCYFLLLIQLILRVDTLSKLAVLLVLNFFSSTCSFSLAKKEAYSWLIARTPFRISSLNLCKRLALRICAGCSPSKS